MATKSLALITAEEHHMSKSEGTELRKDVAAAARITMEKHVVCSFDWNPEENSDLLLSWITQRMQIITHVKNWQNQNEF